MGVELDHLKLVICEIVHKNFHIIWFQINGLKNTSSNAWTEITGMFNTLKHTVLTWLL